MKKILICSGFFAPHIGGHEKAVAELSKRFIKFGYSVDILTCCSSSEPLEQTENNLNILRLPAWVALNGAYPIPKPTRASFQIIKRILSNQYSIINTNTRFFSTSILGFLISKITMAPLVHTEHGSSHCMVANSFVSIVNKIYDHTIGSIIVSSASMNIAISDSVADFLVHLGARNISVVRNGVDAQCFKKSQTNKRASLGIPPTSLVVTYVGRLIQAKGVQDLFGAIPAILKKYSDTKFIIVGDGAFRNDLEQLAGKKQLSKSIMFLGHQSETDVSEILNMSDIFVNPSYSEGMPTTVLEAASVGLPILATDVGGTGEIIQPGISGMLFKPGDIQELTSKLIDLLENDATRKKLGAKAQMVVLSEHDWDKAALKTINLFEYLSSNKQITGG